MIPESSCARKKTVDMYIFATSRNGDQMTFQYDMSRTTFY